MKAKFTHTHLCTAATSSVSLLACLSMSASFSCIRVRLSSKFLSSCATVSCSVCAFDCTSSSWKTHTQIITRTYKRKGWSVCVLAFHLTTVCSSSHFEQEVEDQWCFKQHCNTSSLMLPHRHVSQLATLWDNWEIYLSSKCWWFY